MATVTGHADEASKLVLAEWDLGRPGPIWTWWLGRAGSDGPGFRRWQCWIWWRRRGRVETQIFMLYRLLRGATAAPMEVWRGVQRFGDKTAANHGVTKAVQFLQLLRLRWRHGVQPESYYKFQMFRPERRPVAQHFLEETGQPLQVLLRQSTRASDEGLFLSKEEFRRWCVARGIATVQNLIEVDGGKVVSRFVETLPPVDLFVKPTNLRQGRGASRWRYIRTESGHRYSDGTGRELSTTEFEDFVCRTSIERGRPHIVQPVLPNHAALRGFTNGALATIRLMTVRARGQKSRPLMAALRMPTGSAIADNFDLGGVAAPINLATGACGLGLRKKGEYPPDTVDVHPDGGGVIDGFQVPYWQDCVALTCRAHDLMEVQAPVIGWDVAVLESGPILVEPNYLPCGNLAQMPGGFPLGASPFAEVVVDGLKQALLSDHRGARMSAGARQGASNSGSA